VSLLQSFNARAEFGENLVADPFPIQDFCTHSSVRIAGL
jgi:hypothetical protein